MIYLALIVTSLALTYLGERLLRLQLERQRALLAEWGYAVEYPVCSPLLLGVGVLLCLCLGYALPQTISGKIISCVFLYLLWLFAIVDYKYQFIFDDSNIVFALLGLLATPLLPATIMDQAIGMLAGFAIMFVLALLGRGALGGGDVKLVAVLGWWLGWRSLPIIMFVGFILGGVGAICLLIFTKKDRKAMFAFGPYLVVGAVLAWLAQCGSWGVLP